MDHQQSRMEDGEQVKMKSFRYINIEAHSQTEKRRRDKMNNLIEELSAMIPQCNPIARKLDKLTVLRMAVQHLKSLKGSTSSYAGDNYKPTFIQDDELRHLILKVADGFLFVVGCDRGKILFVSKSVSKTLNYDQASLTGQSLFDYLHPKDVAKVKEQLSSSDISPREKLIDAKTGFQVQANFPAGTAHLYSGARRSFFCRIKSYRPAIKEEQECFPNSKKKGLLTCPCCPLPRATLLIRYQNCAFLSNEPGELFEGFAEEEGVELDLEVESITKFLESEMESLQLSRLKSRKQHRILLKQGKFCTVHCMGYLRSWPLSVVGLEEEKDSQKTSSNFNCLVAIGRLHPYTVPQNSGEIKVKPTEFVTRFATNGKFVYVDQRATAILGYLPQELLGTSCYEYFHHDDHSNLTNKHKAVLQSKEKIFTDSYKFKAKDGSFITLKSQWFSFINPWTKELEYIVSINTLVLGCRESRGTSLLTCSSQSSEDASRQPFISVPGISTGTVLGAGSIGTEIENEVLDLQRLHSSPSLADSSPTNIRDSPAVNCSNVPNKELIQLCSSEIGNHEPSGQSRGIISFSSNEPLLSDNTQVDFDAMCENDDTAMAAFMNYLEAEGGLGDPADFSDIQWTL